MKPIHLTQLTLVYVHRLRLFSHLKLPPNVQVRKYTTRCTYPCLQHLSPAFILPPSSVIFFFDSTGGFLLRRLPIFPSLCWETKTRAASAVAHFSWKRAPRVCEFDMIPAGTNHVDGGCSSLICSAWSPTCAYMLLFLFLTTEFACAGSSMTLFY